MPFTLLQDEKVKTVLASKVTQPCPTCDSRDWIIANELVVFPIKAQANPQPVPSPGAVPSTQVPGAKGSKQLTCIATICAICGNTQFHNVMILGLESEFGLRPSPDENLGRMGGK